MQLHQIEAVVAIAEAGSFRKAADRLNRSQPTLTKSIQSLEAAMNVVIFERTPRGVHLTKLGESFYKRACTVISDIHALEDEVLQMAGQDGGQIRIGVSPVGGTVIMPRALRQFRRKWPKVEVELINVMFPEAVNMLREAALEMVIGPMPTLETHGVVIVEPLFEMEAIIVTHESNPKRTMTDLAAIMDEHWIIHGPKGGPSSLYSGSFSHDKSLMPNAYTHCHSFSSCVSMIVETGAFCVFSQPLFDSVHKSYGLVRVPIKRVLSKFQLSLVTQKSRPLTPAAADLAQHIRRRATTLLHAGGMGDSLKE